MVVDSFVPCELANFFPKAANRSVKATRQQQVIDSGDLLFTQPSLSPQVLLQIEILHRNDGHFVTALKDHPQLAFLGYQKLLD